MSEKRSNSPDLDDIDGDIGNLAHLLDEVVTKILDVDHTDLSESAKNTLNRAVALCWIARDIADRNKEQFWDAVRADRAKQKGKSA